MESMTVAVAINARLFARLREQAGIDSDTVHVPERSTVRAVLLRSSQGGSARREGAQR